MDRTGLVTAKETGTATITAAAEDNGMMKAECAVTVKETLEPVPEPEPAITAPAAPAGVKAASYNYKSLKLSWKLVSGASGYQVYRASSQNGKYALVKTTAASAFVNKGLTTGKNYYYKVRAYKKVGSKTVYGGFSKTAGAKPALKAPAKVRAKAGKKKITVQWKKTDGATGYKVYRATKKNGKYKAVKTIKKQRTVKYVDKKVKKNKRYYYKVRAYKNVDGKKVYSKYSKVVKVRVK